MYTNQHRNRKATDHAGRYEPVVRVPERGAVERVRVQVRRQHGTDGVQAHAWVVGARGGPHQTLRSVAIRAGDGAAGSRGHLRTGRPHRRLHQARTASPHRRAAGGHMTTSLPSRHCRVHVKRGLGSRHREERTTLCGCVVLRYARPAGGGAAANQKFIRGTAR